jgi:hypothetical protein
MCGSAPKKSRLAFASRDVVAIKAARHAGGARKPGRMGVGAEGEAGRREMAAFRPGAGRRRGFRFVSLCASRKMERMFIGVSASRSQFRQMDDRRPHECPGRIVVDQVEPLPQQQDCSLAPRFSRGNVMCAFRYGFADWRDFLPAHHKISRA